MKLHKTIVLLLGTFLTISCAISPEIREINPTPEKMFFEGFSLLTPNEKGWLYKKSERMDSGLVARRYIDGFGENILNTMMAELDENYVLRTTILPLPNFEENGAFLHFVKEKLVNNEYGVRHKMLERYQELSMVGKKNCVLDYYKGKDLKAKKTSSNSDPMILEAMHFICLHPSENTALYFAYSFRYYSKNRDVRLKEKALAVLKNIDYSEINVEKKKVFKDMVANELDDLIVLIKKGFFTI